MENIFDVVYDPIFVSTVIYYDISGIGYFTDVAVFDVSGAAAYIPLEYGVGVSYASLNISVESWEREWRVCDPERNMCPISFETISDDAEYCMCESCQQPFLPQMLETALRRSYTCPYCRAPWTNLVLYTNRVPSV